MNRLALSAALALGACTATVQTVPPPAQPVPMAQPRNHPAYLHALTDLRAARAQLERPANVVVKWDERRAIQEIDAAIREIKEAAIDDGKPLNDHPPVDRPTWGGRLDRALELLGKARADVSEEEDSPSSQVHRLRGRSLEHIANADRLVRDGIEDARALHEAPPPAAPPPAAPPPPPVAAKHPAYIHALSDLRAARAQLQRPANVVVKWDENRAVRELDAAIREIKEAAIDDGKDISDHEPVDRPTWGGRLQRALELVTKARGDVSEEEDSPSSQVHRLRLRSLEHIAKADRLIRDGIEDARALHEAPPPAAPPPAAPPPPPAAAAHPAYLHALSDLRHARALLERPTRGSEVKWDENRAVSQIDAAIHDIKDAAIDDGKPLDDHPPIDAGSHHRDRLRRAIDVLDKAARDIEQREDNAYSSGMRGRAVGHIREAIRATREAIEDRRH